MNQTLRALALASVNENQIAGAWWMADQLEAACMFVSDAEYVAAASPDAVLQLLDAHDCNVDTLNALQVENEGLRDENKALRDALEDIVALDPYSAKEIAREALKQGEKE